MTAHDELSEVDADRAFYKASAPKRLVVLGAGSFLHFVLGYLLIFAIFFGIGTAALTPRVEQVAPCIVTSASAKSACQPYDPPSPAKLAGVKAGDIFVAIDGKKIGDWGTDIQIVRNTPGIAHTINKVGMARVPFGTSINRTSSLTSELFRSSISSLFSLPGKIPALIRQTFTGEKRDAAGLVGVIGVAEASAQTASADGLAWNERIATFLLIIASLNIFVGIFNLLPLLPLDGGHMAIAIIDGLRNTWARIRRKPLPRGIDIETLTPLTMIVFVFLAGLSLLLLVADIINPVHFNL